MSEELGEDRLAQLYLLPPKITTPWTGAEGLSVQTRISRKDRTSLTLDLPLFWYDPPWYLLPTQLADEMAVAVAQMDVMVSAMASDLVPPNTRPTFFSNQTPDPIEPEDDDDEPVIPDPTYLPRMVPYRPERYGLSPEDFDHSWLIDVRLMMSRDASGRFAYSPDQIARWEATPDDQPLAGGGWVPAATFPPDVDTIEQLTTKFDQLRKLAPNAAVFASTGPYRLADEIPAIVKAAPDGVIVRLDEVALDGLQLAALTRRARHFMNEAGGKKLPLWLVPGEISADDAVKLVALGASAIGIDSWCDPLLQECQPSGYSRPPVEEIVYNGLTSRIDRFTGLYLSLQRVKKKERLGSFRMTWANTLGVLPLH